jgi:FkbM family methyltransferase
MFSHARLRLKQYPTLVAAVRLFFNRRDVWRDWWGTRVWKFQRARTTPYGFKLSAGINRAYRLMQQGKFEEQEVHVAQRALEQTDVFVDVGANIGFYSCIALSKGKHVVSVEPQQGNLKVLYKNLSLNNWVSGVEIFPVGLGQAPGVLTLYGASGPSASLLKNWAQYSDRFQQSIPMTTLDILLSNRFSDKNLFIKIDVEGAEYQVLLGAMETLRRLRRPTWLIEICLQEFHPSGINPDYEAIFDLFWANGYEARTANDEARLIQPEDVRSWVAAKYCASGSFNYVFSPKVQLTN